MLRKWETLPKELTYLIAPAERYGDLRTDEERLHFARKLGPAQVKELSEIAEHVRTNMHEPLVDNWVQSKFRSGINAEDDSNLDEMFALMDVLGLDYSSIGKGYSPAEAAERVRQYWKMAHQHSFAWLSEETRKYLPFDEGFDLLTDALAKLPKSEWGDAILGFYEFPSPRTLNWIEENIVWPLGGSGWDKGFESQWGSLAAVCGISWERIARWLDRGRPLSLAALDALKACCRYDNEPLQKAKPKLLSPEAIPIMTQRLNEYAATDSAPKVLRRVERINMHWGKITGGNNPTKSA